MSSSLVTAATREAGQAAYVRSAIVFQENHLTLSLLSILASRHLSFTASFATSVYYRTNLHVLAKSNCDPDIGLRDETRTLSRSEGDHGLETPGLSWPGHCPQECLILSSRRTGFLPPLSPVFLLTSCNEGLTNAPGVTDNTPDNWTQLVTAQRSSALCNQVRLGASVWRGMMPTPELLPPILAQADARRRIRPS